MKSKKESLYEQHRDVFDDYPFKEMARTAHIVTFKTMMRRDLAIEPERKGAFYVWAERYNDGLSGISVRNPLNPGRPYSAQQARNHHLNEKNAPRLKVGNPVWYLRIESVEALQPFLDWYAKQ